MDNNERELTPQELEELAILEEMAWYNPEDDINDYCCLV